MNNIELELRAEIALADFDSVSATIRNQGKLLNQKKRLSVLFLGKTIKGEIDIRVRIVAGGKAELVVKKGDFHTHDRIETAQEITKDQFIGIVRALSLLDFESKVTERENSNYDLGDDVNFSIVKAGSIAYVEIEKMSSSDTVEANRQKLLSILSENKLKIIENKEQFDELCQRLSDLHDWKFNGTTDDFQRLEKELAHY